MPSFACLPGGLTVHTFLAGAILSGGLVPADTTVSRWGLVREKGLRSRGVGPNLYANPGRSGRPGWQILRSGCQ